MISSENNRSTVYPMGIFPSPVHLTLNEQISSATMGKVVRIRPNIYVFVCEFCQSEHKSIDSFLRHSEGHFQRESVAKSRAKTQIHSDCLSPVELIQPDCIPNRHIPFNGYTPLQQPLSTKEILQSPTIDITASPSHNSDDYIEEVYEIIDLGYDLDGNKYPMAEEAPIVSTTNDNPKQQPKIAVKPEKKEKTLKCPFCNKGYLHERSLKRHKESQHIDILSKLTTLKKSFKCSICSAKFGRGNKLDAEKHMKIHFKGPATKNPRKK